MSFMKHNATFIICDISRYVYLSHIYFWISQAFPLTYISINYSSIFLLKRKPGHPISSGDESWFPVFEWRRTWYFHKHLKRSFPLGICMWEGPCVLCFKRNGPRVALIRKKSKFPCRGFMHAHRSYHKMKGCLSPP